MIGTSVMKKLIQNSPRDNDRHMAIVLTKITFGLKLKVKNSLHFSMQ